MKKQWFAVAICSVLLILVGLLWWRVRELEKTVNSLRYQPVTNSTVVWPNEQRSKNEAPKKQVFKLIDSPEPVNSGTSKVGIPWNVERAMMGDGKGKVAPMQQGESHWDVKATPPNPGFVPDQPESK